MQETVRCFPRSDPAFAQRVSALLRATDISEEALVRTIEVLRTEYPRARIIRQSRLAADGDRLVYVYRDGELLNGPPGDDPG